MAIKHLLEIDGMDFAPYVERDSYSTDVQPQLTRGIRTMDGVEHVTKIRDRGEVHFKLNPQNAEKTEMLCQHLAKVPVLVHYHCLKRNQEISAYMKASGGSAQYLSRCLYKGQSWNELEEITLEEM